jgi:hypothetical protein
MASANIVDTGFNLEDELDYQLRHYVWCGHSEIADFFRSFRLEYGVTLSDRRKELNGRARELRERCGWFGSRPNLPLCELIDAYHEYQISLHRINHNGGGYQAFGSEGRKGLGAFGPFYVSYVNAFGKHVNPVVMWTAERWGLNDRTVQRYFAR